jgi:hypothetical protein
MRFAHVLEGATDPRRRTPAGFLVGGAHALAWAFLAGSWAMLLAGCAVDDGSRRPTRVRDKDVSVQAASRAGTLLPDRTLLTRLPSPNCEQSAGPPQSSIADPNAELARRIRAEYDLACYRTAEALARQRLEQLQVWIAKTRDRPSTASD